MLASHMHVFVVSTLYLRLCSVCACCITHDVSLAQRAFGTVGSVLKAIVHYDRSGRSKGSADVIFASRADAQAAVKQLNGVELEGKPLQLTFAAPSGGAVASAAPRRNFNNNNNSSSSSDNIVIRADLSSGR